MTQALIAKAGQPLPPEEVAKLPAMKMEDEGRYVFDRKLGLMREGMIKRRIEADTQRRFDGWEIRLVKAPKR